MKPLKKGGELLLLLTYLGKRNARVRVGRVLQETEAAAVLHSISRHRNSSDHKDPATELVGI